RSARSKKNSNSRNGDGPLFPARESARALLFLRFAVLQQRADAPLEWIAPRKRARLRTRHEIVVLRGLERVDEVPRAVFGRRPDLRIEPAQVERTRVGAQRLAIAVVVVL